MSEKAKRKRTAKPSQGVASGIVLLILILGAGLAIYLNIWHPSPLEATLLALTETRESLDETATSLATITRFASTETNPAACYISHSDCMKEQAREFDHTATAFAREAQQVQLQFTQTAAASQATATP